MLLVKIKSSRWYIIHCGDFMKPLKEKISITVDNDVLRKLRDLSEADDRSLSQYINLILREHIRTIDKDAKKIN